MESAIMPELVLESIVVQEYSMIVYLAVAIILLIILLKLARKNRFSIQKFFKVINIIYISGLIAYIVVFNLDIPQIFSTNIFRLIILLTPLVLIDLISLIIFSCFNYFKKKKLTKKYLLLFSILFVISIFLIFLTYTLWRRGYNPDFIYYYDEIIQLEDTYPWMKPIE